MSVLTKYLVVQIAKQQLLALLALCLIFGLFTLYEQSDQVGRGSYSALDAIWYVLLTTPDRAVEFAPIGALLGTLLIFDRLSKGGELISMLSGGCSPLQLISRSLIGCLPLIILYVIAVQWLAPPLYKNAELHRITRTADASRLDNSAGIWIRRDRQIMNIALPATDIENNPLLIYELGEDGRLVRQTIADSFLATDDGRWQLFGVVDRTWQEQSMLIKESAEELWEPFAGNIQDELQQLPLNTLSLSRLRDKYTHTEAVGGSGYLISVHFWKRVVGMLLIAGMAMLVVVFVLTGISAPSLAREFSCMVLGMLAYVSGAFISGQSIFYIEPLIASLLPVCFLFIMATVTARRHELI